MNSLHLERPVHSHLEHNSSIHSILNAPDRASSLTSENSAAPQVILQLETTWPPRQRSNPGVRGGRQGRLGRLRVREQRAMRTCTATLLLFYCSQTSLVYVRHKGDPATSPRTKVRGNMVAVSYGRRNSPAGEIPPHATFHVTSVKIRALSCSEAPWAQGAPGMASAWWIFLWFNHRQKEGSSGNRPQEGQASTVSPDCLQAGAGGGLCFSISGVCSFLCGSVGVRSFLCGSFGVRSFLCGSFGVRWSPLVSVGVSESSCVIVSGFRAALDLDTYHIGT